MASEDLLLGLLGAVKTGEGYLQGRRFQDELARAKKKEDREEERYGLESAERRSNRLEDIEYRTGESKKRSDEFSKMLSLRRELGTDKPEKPKTEADLLREDYETSIKDQTIDPLVKESLLKRWLRARHPRPQGGGGQPTIEAKPTGVKYGQPLVKPMVESNGVDEADRIRREFRESNQTPEDRERARKALMKIGMGAIGG